MSLNNSLNIGHRAMTAQQSSITTTGHNIANVNTKGFSRQRSAHVAELPNGDGTGGGVRDGKIKRVFDRFSQNKVIEEQSNTSMFEARDKFLQKVEVVFNEMEGAGLRQVLNEYWDSWSLLANEPESDAARLKVRDQGDSLAKRFRSMNGELKTIRAEANSRVAGIVSEINLIANQIADLNRQIVVYESGDRVANDARDSRMQLMEKLSSLVDVRFFENNRGDMNVSVGHGWTLVEGRNVRPLKANLLGGELGMYHVEAAGKNEFRRDITEEIRSGELKEILDLRDRVIVEYLNQLDDMAFGLAQQVNQIHATGTGLNASYESLKSSYGLNEDARNVPLPFIKDGTFQVHLLSEDNDVLETYEIEVMAGVDTVHDIIDRFNETVGDTSFIYAGLEDDGSMRIQAGGGKRFIFGEDSTNLTMVMGFNNFFETLKGAEDMQVRDVIMQDPQNIATGRDLIPGDNRVALEISLLQTVPTMENNSQTFDEYYNGILADVGLRMQRNQVDKEHQENLLKQFTQIRDSVTSVNMDEEVANMIQQQRAYEAAAKFTSTIDTMMETVIRM